MEKQQQEITRLENELEELKRKSVSPRKLEAVQEELYATQTMLQHAQTENKSLSEKIMQNQHRFVVIECDSERVVIVVCV